MLGKCLAKSSISALKMPKRTSPAGLDKMKTKHVTWRKEAHQQHRLEGISVQPLADAHAPKQLPRGHAIVPGAPSRPGFRGLQDPESRIESKA